MTENEFRERLIAILLQTGNMSKRELNKTVGKIGQLLPLYRNSSNPDVWFNNKQIKQKVEKFLKEYSSNLTNLTQANVKRIWELSEQKNDLITQNMIIGIAGTSIAAGKLYRYFNRVLPGKIHPNFKIKVTKSSIEDIIRSPRNEEALNAFLKRKVKGLELSERVWNLADKRIMPLIESHLAAGIKKGSSATEISREIREYLNEPEKIFRRIRDSKTGKLKLSTRARDYNPG